MDRITPGDTPDPLKLNLIIGTRWDLEKQPEDLPWRMVVVYRGLHCPLCKTQLQELSGKLDKFVEAGCAVVTASMDTEARAKQAHSDWELADLPVAYGVEEETLRRYGCYISTAIKEDEPERFAEPAIFLFRGGELHCAWTQTVPFARPQLDDLLSGIKFLEKEDYPPRGTA